MKKSAKTQSEQMPAQSEEHPMELALRTSELRYRRLFESAQDGILILDGETGEIIDINPFLLDLLNYPFREMVGLKLWEIGQFQDIAANQAAFEKLQQNEYIRYDNLPLRTKGGKTIQVEFVSNVYLVGAKKIIQCNIRDISARAKVHEASQRHLTALEMANKAKDEFLAALSHELRTPLSAISSMVDVLELDHSLANMRDVTHSPSELDNSGLALIRRNVHILVSLINELLDLTHISRGDLLLDLKTIDAHHAIGDALRDVAAELKAKRIDLRVQLQAACRHIKADSAKFHRILSNLIGNAIKFTPIGGRILVATSSGPSDDLVIEISDNGIGIEPEFCSSIFSPFEQGDASIQPRFGGLGLGLSISRSLAEAHGATLELESEGLNRGATFRLRFKTEQLSPEEENPASQPGPRKSMYILLVDDHADTRRCLCRLLESHGHRVRSADDAQTAIELSEREKFDLLLADLGLPDRTGLELLHELRQHQPELPAIAFSGYGMPQDVLKSKEAGFLEHLVKPVDLHKLHTVIDALATGKNS